MSKLTLDDIFNDDDFGLLNDKPKNSSVKTEDDRLVDSFEEINNFFEKNKREPGSSSMSEFNLYARLKAIREDESKKRIVKPFDRYDLLGYVEMEEFSFDDVINDDDLGLLNSEGDLSIFKFVHTPKPEERAETDTFAQRKPIKQKDFLPYEKMFQEIQQDLKEGRRKLQTVENVEKNIFPNRFYLMDGLLLYLENIDYGRDVENLKESTKNRKDGRTTIVFENATKSNMLFRSLTKQLYKAGKLITDPLEKTETDLYLYKNGGLVSEKSTESGWIYILKSKSSHSQINSIKNLYKIGLSKTNVEDRIKNASKEATYLFSDVEVIAKYRCYDLDLQVMENLIHRFFSETCLNIDLNLQSGQRITPREWFVAPLQIIDEAIHMLISGTIVNYRYSKDAEKIVLK